MYSNSNSGLMESDFKLRMIKYYTTILTIMTIETVVSWLHVEFGDISTEAFLFALYFRLSALAVAVFCSAVVCFAK
jgi:hypothetical protein